MNLTLTPAELLAVSRPYSAEVLQSLHETAVWRVAVDDAMQALVVPGLKAPPHVEDLRCKLAELGRKLFGAEQDFARELEVAKWDEEQTEREEMR